MRQSAVGYLEQKIARAEIRLQQMKEFRNYLRAHPVEAGTEEDTYIWHLLCSEDRNPL